MTEKKFIMKILKDKDLLRTHSFTYADNDANKFILIIGNYEYYLDNNGKLIMTTEL